MYFRYFTLTHTRYTLETHHPLTFYAIHSPNPCSSSYYIIIKLCWIKLNRNLLIMVHCSLWGSSPIKYKELTLQLEILNYCASSNCYTILCLNIALIIILNILNVFLSFWAMIILLVDYKIVFSFYLFILIYYIIFYKLYYYA